MEQLVFYETPVGPSLYLYHHPDHEDHVDDGDHHHHGDQDNKAHDDDDHDDHDDHKGHHNVDQHHCMNWMQVASPNLEQVESISASSK